MEQLAGTPSTSRRRSRTTQPAVPDVKITANTMSVITIPSRVHSALCHKDRFAFAGSGSTYDMSSMPVIVPVGRKPQRSYALAMQDNQETEADSEAVTPEVIQEPEKQEDERTPPHVTEPSKLLRIASMTRAMLEEVREAPLDDAGRSRLLSIYERSLEELKGVLSEDLREELDAVFVPIDEESPSEAELRIAQAQLVGWLEGLFHGIQASLISQQMAASAQLDLMQQRKAIEAESGKEDGSGLYL
jgi:hypothetical protein